MKLAVVVNGGTPIIFEGQKISAYHDGNILIINDLTHDPPKKVAAFNLWTYWTYKEEK